MWLVAGGVGGLEPKLKGSIKPWTLDNNIPSIHSLHQNIQMCLRHSKCSLQMDFLFSVSRFTEENFATLIAVIFIIKALGKTCC
jgi:hypothetical protein